MTKTKKYRRSRNLEDIQKELAEQGELVMEEMTSTKAETIFGKALLNAGIQIIPQFDVDGRSFDFKVFHYPILIEIDGLVHTEVKKRYMDYRKDRYVQRRGYRVMRFTNTEATENYLSKAIIEVKAMIRYCGRMPREIHLYPLSIWEQVMYWWKKKFGGYTDYDRKIKSKIIR